MKYLLLLSIFGLSGLTTLAQSNVPELITDRPDQTESSTTVPHKSLQVETGFLYEFDKTSDIESKNFAYNTTLLRYGILNNFELRLGLEYLATEEKFKTPDSTYTTSGTGPLHAGFKVNVTEEKGLLPEIAVLAGFDIPHTAVDDYKTEYLAPSIRLSVSHTLSDRFSIGYNLGAEWDGDTAIPGYYYSLALGIGLTETLGAFIESYGTVPTKGDDHHLADAGFTYLITPVFQLDASGGIGLNEEANDYFISFGLTYRF